MRRARSTVEENNVNVLTRNDLCATFTADKLSFWQGGIEVAYVSNNRLNISSVNITDTMKIGPWEITQNNGFTLRYVG